jgi:hypothetical protein
MKMILIGSEMLHGINKTIPIQRFLKKLPEFSIKYNESEYLITPNNTKRKPVFDKKDGIIIDTLPLKVKDGKLEKYNYINNTKLVTYNPNKHALTPSHFHSHSPIIYN